MKNAYEKPNLNKGTFQSSENSERKLGESDADYVTRISEDYLKKSGYEEKQGKEEGKWTNGLTGLSNGPRADAESVEKIFDSVFNSKEEKTREEKIQAKIKAIRENRKKSILAGDIYSDNIMSDQEIIDQAKKEVDEGISVNK